MRHALVTGAGGFIGTVLCQALRERGIRVTALLRSSRAGPWNAQIVLDLAREAPCPDTMRGVDTVFHLAGHAHAEETPGSNALHAAVSVDGTRRMLSACGAGVQAFVYASSVKAMGEATSAACVDETAPALPTTAYGRARLDAEKLVLAEAVRLHAVVLRLPLVYGPGVKGNLGRMLRVVAAGRAPLLPDLGNRRSLVHVEDVCAALIAAAQTPRACSRVYLVTDGEVYASRTIQQLMYDAAGRSPPFTVPLWALRVAARGGELLHALGVRRVPLDSAALAKLSGHACFDCTRARRELGYAPAHTLAESLPAMLRGCERAAPRGNR